MKKHSLKYCLALAAASLVATTTHAQAAPETRATLRTMKQSMRSEMGRKLGTELMMLQQQTARLGKDALAKSAMAKAMPGIGSGYVAITAYATDNAEALKADLESRGMLDAVVVGNAISGRVPVMALSDMARSSRLRFMRPNQATSNAGVVTSQADRVMLVAPSRQAFGVDGRGIRIGVISDSFDIAGGQTTAADDSRDDDLPAEVQVLRECNPVEGCTDEGRAMMQLIHDLAPASPLSFHTDGDSEVMMAAGIRALAAAGARVIVDDISFPTEPMFQDGLIAQAVDEVVRSGVTYFSSAGNHGRASYAAAFRATPDDGQTVHDFDPGPGVDITQRVSVFVPPGVGARSRLTFQWDEPFASLGGAGSPSDIDIVFVGADDEIVRTCDNIQPGDTLCQIPGADANVGQDALEVAALINLTNQPINTDALSVGIVLFSGPAPRRMQYIALQGRIQPTEFVTNSPTIYGHANAAGAEAVAAASYVDTIFSGARTNCLPACAQSFSSAGSVPILFNTAGTRLAQPLLRANKPGITAADNTNTTFFGGRDIEGDGFPNFSGTSASAPHAAAVAALMYDRRARSMAAGNARQQLTPTQVRRILRDTALDMTQERLTTSGIGRLPAGNDAKTGAGFIQAVNAIQAAQ